MEHQEILSDFLTAVEKDARISITHIGIFAALIQFWKEQQFINPMIAYSHDIMGIAKISAAATYYKCMKDLNEYGYIRYEPSYKRNQGSKIYIKLG